MSLTNTDRTTAGMAAIGARAKDAAAQLDFVYRHSPYMEQSFNRYPVYRVE